MCTYWITIAPVGGGTFIITSNQTLEFVKIVPGVNEEAVDISPLSSSYGMVYLEESSEVNYNLDLSFNYKPPQ